MAILTANSNCEWRHKFYGAKTQECLIQYIPQARYLIDTYCNEYWKNLPNDLNFIMLEVSLALSLHSLSFCIYTNDIKMMIEVLAKDLKVPALQLYNDRNLPLLDVNRETDFMKVDREYDEFLDEKKKWFAEYQANHPNG